MKQIFSSAIFDNPLPQVLSKQSVFPGICVLPDGRILACHTIGQAFESADQTVYTSISEDGGKTWSKPIPIFDKSNEAIQVCENGKPTTLPDGRVMVLGYQFERQDPEMPVGNPETGGLLPDDIFYTISEDMGKTWSEKHIVDCAWHRSVEASAPMYVLKDGSWATPITGFPNWEGKMVSRNCGRLLRSYDEGKTWNDDVVCTEFPNDEVTCYEQRLCQTDDGSIIVISWNENTRTGERMSNHVTISHDNGKTFSAPIDTGIKGQASSILPLGGNKILTIHAMRRDTDEPGIYFCVAEIKDGKFVIESFERVWAPKTPVVKSEYMAEIFAFLKFGQPSAVRLADGKILMCHWHCEDGCYKTIATCFEGI